MLSFGNQKNLNTMAFRRAVRIYAQNLYKYKYDDVNYKE